MSRGGGAGERPATPPVAPGARSAAAPAAGDPDSYLDSLAPFGWRLGLERMHLLTTALGFPQRRFASIHVVGTNGKSSVTRMTAALLAAHGMRSGACLSPHAARWSERTLIGGEEVGAPAWAAAVEKVVRAAEAVERGLAAGEAVTQFEAATAASFVALADARVEVAVVEAGLGGRLDATNTIPSRVTVLSSVGLDHTEHLGASEVEIAAEKLAVLGDQTVLVVGRVGGDVEELARRTAAERGARLVIAPEDPGAEVELGAAGSFQRRNFAVAMAAAEAFLGALEPGQVAAVASALTVPGRLEPVAADPPVYIDAAHNPQAAAALAEALPALAAGRPVIACLAVLADKDAAAMLRALAPALDRVIATELPGADGPIASSIWTLSARRPALGARELAALCAEAGVAAEAEPDLRRALRRAREIAAGEPPGLVLVAGSNYLLAPARAAL